MQFIDLKSQYQALKTSIDARIQKVLDHGQYIMGPEVGELEAALAQLTGAKHCITVASGTEALLIALMAEGIGPGHEVITTPFTFAATAETIVLAGAKPVYVDIRPGDCNIDPALIEAAITPATRAIMPVSLYGQVADMDEINAIAARHGLSVIEDAAQSFGATYKGRKSCNVSKIGATSFFPASRSAAMATAVPCSPATTPWPRPCARSACMARASVIPTLAWAWAAAWIRCNAPSCWASSSASRGRSSNARSWVIAMPS